MTVRLANIAGRAVLVDGDQYFDVEVLSGGSLASDPMAHFADIGPLRALAAGLDDATPTGSLADVTLDAPVPFPRQVFGIGLNYRAHVEESGMEAPSAPVVFTKFPTCIGAPDAEIPVPNESIDYEAEMVVVIGRGGTDIAVEDAWDHVFGITAGQDISDRALQFAAKPAHFDLGKSRRNYGAIGPVVVSVDAFDDPDDIAIECTVNGELRQDATTRQLIFDVPYLIAYLSGILELAPGDLIFTGTPDGVGMATGNMLKPGDEIVTTIEGVGVMTNRCV